MSNLSTSEQVTSNISDSLDSSCTMPKSKISTARSQKEIFVCTICQVFSPQLDSLSFHIKSEHFKCVQSDKSPEDFILPLKALQGTGKISEKSQNGPKNGQIKRVQSFEKKQLLSEPVPGPGGLFWCKNCLRNFRKVRQLMQHICFEHEEMESFSDDSPMETDDDDFKTYVDINPIPWSRKKTGKHLKGNLSKNPEPITAPSIDQKNEDCPNIIPNWRSDPSYIPLFKDEEEKASFEQHLKSIDYSCIDTLFRTEKKQLRANNNKNCNFVQRKVFSCNCCRKVLKSLTQIRLHCLTHTDFKPFSCPKCEYCTNSKGSLYIHMRKHTGNMFSCSSCDFKTLKRAHLLDHEATHSSLPQLCKICKNSYKTQRSLVAHVRKYHCNPVGKRYAKSLTAKGNKNFQCSICKKRFKSNDIFQNHNQVCHGQGKICNTPKINAEQRSENNLENVDDLFEAQKSNLEQSSNQVQCNNSEAKDPLAEIVLNNLLQQEQSDRIMYDNVFNESSENVLQSSEVLLDFQDKDISALRSESSSVLNDCQKTLNLSILNHCLQNTDFTNNCNQEFSLPIEQNCAKIDSNNDSDLQDISGDKVKPAEIKLFEKCRRAPAYVCCVCSAIYICQATLKVHLKEHINSTTSNSLMDQPDEQFEPSRMADSANHALDKVCEILQNSSENCSFDEELEKLYTSSLDMMWYLPEVSVVLQNDPALIDSVLDDISNFPLSDKYDSPQDMNDKDENVLKCFDENLLIKKNTDLNETLKNSRDAVEENVKLTSATPAVSLHVNVKKINYIFQVLKAAI